MDFFKMLPEDCISKIISLTSPKEAAQSSVLSKGFKSAADSDIVWDSFLPTDIHAIISRSNSPLEYSSKKNLYITLSYSPLLLDGAKLSFSLDKTTGNKCYLIAARELIISWGDSYWSWPSLPISRFSEVAVLNSVCWLDIRGRLQCQTLSPNCNYAAYLVFQLKERSRGLESAKSVIRFVDHEADCDAERRATKLYLSPESGRLGRGDGNLNVPHLREDGWLEVEMGSFFNEQGDDRLVEARLIEIEKLNGKSGLIVEGIEFRVSSKA